MCAADRNAYHNNRFQTIHEVTQIRYACGRSSRAHSQDHRHVGGRAGVPAQVQVEYNTVEGPVVFKELLHLM